MTDGLEKKHGLEALSQSWPADKGVALAIRSDLGHLNLRGDAEDAAFLDAAEKALGVALPTRPNTIAEGDATAFWLGPDEWLVLSDAGSVAQKPAALEAAHKACHFAVNDVSGGQLALTLKGERVRATLAKGCTLDFHPGVFARGLCAQSGLAKASVLLAPVENDEFMIVVRRSFSDYLLRWLAAAV